MQYLNQKNHHLKKYLNNYQLKVVNEILENSSIYYYDAFIKILNQDGVDGFKDFIKLKSEFLIKDYNRFYHKINKLYTNKRLYRYMDEDKIDLMIGNVIYQWKRYVNFDSMFLIKRNRSFNNFDFFKNPVIQAMLEENVLIYERYSSLIYFNNMFCSNYISNIWNEYKKQYFPSIFSRIKFFKYLVFDCTIFGYNIIGLGSRYYLVKQLKDRLEYSKMKGDIGRNIKYDVPMELYKGEFLNYEYYDDEIGKKITNYG